MKRINFLAFAAIVATACNSVSGSGNGAASSGSTAASGGDMYFEYTSHTASASMTMNTTSKLYFSADGKMRKEMVLTNPAKPDKGSPIISIGSADKPLESISIDDDAKTWTTNHLDTADLDNSAIHMTSTVTKLDNEKMMGFDCVHVRIISNKDIGGLIKELDTMDIWKSKDVPIPSVFVPIMERINSGTQFIYARDVPAQLKQMGCDGFLVKMQTRSKDVASVWELTKAEHRDLPKSLFVIPAGYKEDKSGL